MQRRRLTLKKISLYPTAVSTSVDAICVCRLFNLHWSKLLSNAQILMSTESVAQEGPTSEKLAFALAETPSIALSRDAFLLNLPSGLRFHYAQGYGVRFSRPDTVTDAEVKLFLNGSVYGAIAWINGFLPLHTSAVIQDGKVHAIAGDSGAGKSTLAAALSIRGLPLFADDVLVLDMSNDMQIVALPGHKQLKLWADALALTELTAGERVSESMEKYFVEPPLIDQARPLPLAALYFLDDHAQSVPTLSLIGGAERFKALSSALYRPEFCAILVEKKDLFLQISRLARELEMCRFDRPRNRDLFSKGADFIASAIREKNK